MTRTRTVSMEGPSPEQTRVHRVWETLHRDGAAPGGALEGLATIVEDDTWRRVAGPDGESFRSFRAFVEARPPFGLGTDEPELRKIISLRHPHERSAKIHERMEAMRATVKRLLGEDIEPIGPAIHAGSGRGRKTVRGTKGLTGSDTVDYIVARLKRDDPSLAAQVVGGEITANAAARAAGIRKPRIVLSSPERIAASLRRHLPPEVLAKLRELLQGP
jgi:hypothetical protein